MGRAPCCEKVGLKKGPWTPEEDEKLVSYIREHGHGSWRALPQNAGLLRCGKSCRLRWTNYLRPDIKRGNFTVQEEQTIIQLHALLGNRWSTIATHLPKRTDNEIKNYWNTHLKKRLSRMGIDPVTHKPKSDSLNAFDGQSAKHSSALSHMAQWESARLEAEARLARQSRLRNKSLFSNQMRVNIFDNVSWNKGIVNSRCLDVLNGSLSGANNNNNNNNSSCFTGSSNSPTSTLSFVEGTSTNVNPNYLSMVHKASPRLQFQIPLPSSDAEKKPLPDELARFLLGNETTTGDQISNPAEAENLLFPILTDAMLLPDEPHSSSTFSVTSAEEQSALAAEATEISSHEDATTTSFEGCFNTDLLLDLAEPPNSELEDQKSMNKDYWINILDMVSSPGDNSTVQNIF